MFSNPAPILSKPRIQALLEEQTKGKVIEIGAGCLRNSLFLLNEGFRTTAVDLPGMEDRFPKQYQKFRQRGGTVLLGKFPVKGQFDFGICTFVVETICEPVKRFRLLKNIARKLSRHGFLILSTRGPADVVTAHAKGIRCSDGFLTPQKTFVRAFNRAQLSRLLRSAGFARVEFLHKPGINSPELLHVIAFK